MKPRIWIKVRKSKDGNVSGTSLIGLIKILSISRPLYLGTLIEIKRDETFFWIDASVKSKETIKIMKQQADSFKPYLEVIDRKNDVD